MTDPRFGSLAGPHLTLSLLGGTVVDPMGGKTTIRDLHLRDGVLVDDRPHDAETVDASGLVIAPGFCDLHAHLREPGAETAETIGSGARAAARGGFTTVCAMPNTEPAVDRPDRVPPPSAALACRVRTIGAATIDRAGVELTDVEALARAGVVAISDDGAAVPDSLLEPLLQRAAAAGLPLIEHPEDPVLAAGGVMRAGPTAVRLGLPGWTPEAEVRIVDRDIAAAEVSGARIHLTHLSTAAAVDAVRAARARGVRVTCDVTPHHLAMTAEWVAGARRFAWEEELASPIGPDAYSGACRVNPPLGSRQDALALVHAVDDGAVDAIATDHAPHPPERTLVPFEEAAPGLIGLETALSLGLAAVHAGRMSLEALIAALAVRPAAIIGEARALAVGAVADLVVFDPEARWRVERASLVSRSTNTPLLGMDLPGVVRLTIADGRATYRSDRG